MKNCIKICLAFTIALFAVSCVNDAEKSINELEKLVEKVEKNYKTYTEDDWENVFEDLDELTEKYVDVRYSEKQMQKIQNLNSKMAEYCIENLVTDYGKIFSGAMKGFVNGLQNVVDEFEDLLDEIDER